MSIIDTATGARPGSCCNYDLAQFLDWLLRFKDVAVTSGDFEVSRATDGITYTNDPSDDLITNTLTETGVHLGDDSDPAYSRLAGSLANVGSGFGLRPSDPDGPQWEVYFRVDSGDTSNLFLRTYISMKGGFAALSVAGQEPVPVLAGDYKTNLWNVGIPTGGLRSNGFCTSSEARPGFAFTAHIPGSDSVYASFIAEYCQPDTLDDDDPDPAKRDTYPCLVRFVAGNNTHLTEAALSDSATIDTAGGSGWCTRFADGLTTTALASGGEYASTLGRNTTSGREALLPLMFLRPTSAGIARGAGWKGCSTWLTWCATGHRFGENGNEASATARERFAAGDVYLRCTGREIER